MSDAPALPVLNHDLADDELAWVKEIYADFDALRVAAGSGPFNPKETLRAVMAQPEHRLPGPIELSGPGPWRNGRNRHGRLAAAVFLPKVELHRHSASRTDQFPMYVVGEAEGFALDASGQPTLTPVTGGGHFHNPPNAPHAFVPKTGQAVPADWEIAFIAITPRNLREDTQAVSAGVRAAYKNVVGTDAPLGV